MIEDDEGTWLCKGVERLSNTAVMKLPGRHNQVNALAALALGDTVGIPMVSMLKTLSRLHRPFASLSVGCRKRWSGVDNDSKATNVGASVAAIEGLGET